MKRSLRAVLVLGILAGLVVALGGGAASGQDGPSLVLSGDDITVEGEGADATYSVESEGTYDVTISGSGFTIDVFVLQCPGAAGSLEALAEGDPTTLCDLGNLLPASPDADGNFEVQFTGVEVDGCGLAFAAGDTAQTETAAALLSVANPPADVECEVVETEGYDDTLAGTGQEGDEADDALADTGLNSVELALIAAAVLAAGWLITHEARRMHTRRLP